MEKVNIKLKMIEAWRMLYYHNIISEKESERIIKKIERFKNDAQQQLNAIKDKK